MELQSSGPRLLLILAMLVSLTSANVANIARHLTADYELINHNPGGTYYASIILWNRGTTNITSAGKWSLYFCHENLIEFERFNTSTGKYLYPTSRGGFLLSHIDGCMYKFTPDPLRYQNIMPNNMTRITFLAAASISGLFDVYPMMYIANNKQSWALIKNTESYRDFVLPFKNIFQYTRDPPRDPILPVSPSRSYMILANQTVKVLQAGDIIPTPLMKSASSGKVVIDQTWKLYSPRIGPEVDRMMLFFKERLEIDIDVSPRQNNVIVFNFGSAPSFVENSDEWYNLTISDTFKYVNIVGKTTHGWLNGFQTLFNMLEEKVQPGGLKYYEAPQLIMVDAPRFKHRSLLLDVASQFVRLEDVRKLLEVMSMVKLNKLQLLLANDYGIRLEIDTMPGFHQVGSKRCHDETEQSCLFSQLGSDPSGTGLGSGFYTAKEYQQLLTLAKQLHIEIIPMWNFDSNMRASEIAIRAYSKASRNQTMNWSLPQLDKTSLLKPNLYRIGKIDICADETLRFIRTIISTIKSYHKAADYPLKTFAIGGEDTDPDAWYNKCRLRGKFNNNLKNPYVHSKLEFNQKLANIFVDQNIAMNAYDNQFSAFPTRCKSASDCTDWFTPYDLRRWIPNEKFQISITHRDPRVMFMTRARMMPHNVTVGPHDRETKMRMFQRTGYPSIISLQDVLDFSIKEEPGPDVQGEMPFGRSPIPLQHVFSMWPESMCCSRYECFRHTNVKRDYAFHENLEAPLCVEDRNATGPIGMQATISTRKVINGTVLFTLLFPRLIAFAERAWHRASWENTVKRPITNGTAAQIQEVEDFLKFKTILGKKILPKLDEHKVQYYMAPPGAVMKKVNNDPLNLDAEVTAKTEFPGLVAQIKTNLMQNFEDVVNNKKYGGSDVEFRTRNRDNTVFGRTEVVFKNATDIYMREHVKLTKHLHDSVYLEFPIQTRDIGKDDPDGRISYSLQDSLPLYFDKEFGYFFNKTGFEKFRRDRPALVEQARIRQQQHMLMMQEHRKRMMALNAARANNQNSMNQVGNVGNNQGGARPVGWTPGSNQNMIQGRQGQNG